MGVECGCQLWLGGAYLWWEEVLRLDTVFYAVLCLKLPHKLLLDIIEISENISDIFVHILLQLLLNGHLHQIIIQVLCDLLYGFDILFDHNLFPCFEFTLQLLQVASILRIGQLTNCLAPIVLVALLINLFEHHLEFLLGHRQLRAQDVILNHFFVHGNRVPKGII